MNCDARGCPLVGSCSDDGNLYCQFHLGKHFNDFPKITQKIVNIKYAIDHYYFVKRATPVEWINDSEKFYTTSHENLNKRVSEGHYEYIDRLWDTIKGYIGKGAGSKGHVQAEDPYTVDDYMSSFKNMNKATDGSSN